jgi:hypothetical protein
VKHVIPHALSPTSHFVSLLTCSHSTGQKIPHFYRTIRLIIKFTKACLWILHPGPAESIPQCTPVSTTKCPHLVLFLDVFHAHVEGIYHRGLEYYMPNLSRPQFNRPDNVSSFVCILYSPDIFSLLDPNIQLVTLTLPPDFKQC